MPITQDTVLKMAHLARLQVADKDLDRYQEELSGILDLVAQMNTVDTVGVMPAAHPLDAPQRLRPDEITEPDQREHFQRHAPAVEQGLYLVPKVID